MASLIRPAAFVAAIALLLAVYLDPDVTSMSMKSVPPTDADGTIVKVAGFERLTFSVKVDGEKIHCWLFSPTKPLAGKEPPPVVVAAYGLGVQKDIAFVPLATSLAGKGFGVVLFDYRHWGVSEGLPRHMADPEKEIKDLKGVLQHLSDTGGLQGKVDHKKMALYGSSMGGGIVLATASLLASEKNLLKEKIKAVVASVPFVNGNATQAAAREKRGFVEHLRIVGATVQDIFMSLVSRTSAVYIKLASLRNEGSLSAMQLDDSDYEIWASRMRLKEKKLDGAWENKLAARTFYNIINFEADRLVVDYLDTPCLVIAGSNDAVCPLNAIREMADHHAQKAERSKLTLKEFPLNHFEFLNSENFPKLVEAISAFLKNHF